MCQWLLVLKAYLLTYSSELRESSCGGKGGGREARAAGSLPGLCLCCASIVRKAADRNDLDSVGIGAISRVWPVLPPLPAQLGSAELLAPRAEPPVFPDAPDCPDDCIQEEDIGGDATGMADKSFSTECGVMWRSISCS